jgi:two-component system cell cycle sensor histidine kinase/response regulator CckA
MKEKTEKKQEIFNTSSLRKIAGEVLSGNTGGIMLDIPADSSRSFDENAESSLTTGIRKIITGQRRNEEKLQWPGEKNETIIENIRDGYFEVDLAGNFTFFNKSICEMHGYPREELMGMNNRQYTDKANAKKSFDAFNNIYRTGISGSIFDYEITRKDGTKRQVEVAASLKKDESGRPIGFYGIARDITERKKAEETIRQSEERYRTILDEMEEVYFEVDLAGNFTFLNDAVCRLLKYPKEDLLGKSFRIHVHKDDIPILYDAFGKIYKTGMTIRDIRYKAVRSDGTIGFAEIAGLPLLNRQGEIIGFRGIGQEITRHMQMEENLWQSEEKYRNIIEDIQDGYFELDLSGSLTFFNESICKIHGYSREELMGMNHRQFADKENSIKAYEAFNKIYNTGTSSNLFDYEIIRKDGTRRQVEISASLIKDSAGKPIGFRGTTRDVTERKKMEEMLRQSEERYRTILDETEDAYFEVDIKGNITFLNDAICRLLRYPREELMGKSFRVHVAEEDMHIVYDAFALIYNTGKPVRDIRYKAVRRDGTTGYAEMTGFPLRNRNGEIIGFRGVGREITERIQAEEEKARLESQLLQAQKMESVGRLAGGVAHDFNNMLSVILGRVEMALMKIDPAQPITASLQEIRKAANRSADLTRQLLAFARKQAITPVVLDLNKTVESMLKMLQRLIGEDIDLTWLPGDGVWPVMMDPSQIDQILANLCVNARDAISGIGKISIETNNVTFDEEYCSMHHGFVPGDYVRLALSDNGCGMDKETLAQVFEPFFTTKETGKGTGLGMATVYGIVKQNNGFINAYSEPGKGTTFTIYLPRYEGKATETQTETASEQSTNGNETILLVEDEPSILNMTAMMLQNMGYTVLAASGSRDAILMAEDYASHNIHMIISDVVMPEMNGPELAKKILELYPHLKVLFMSGYTADIVALHGVLDHGMHFIQKPFSVSALAAKVREVLEANKE